jgi:hypothetical protein
VPARFTGTVFYHIAAGDLDGDGLTDIAAIGVVQDGNPNTPDPIDLHIVLQDPVRPGRFTVGQRIPLSSPLGVVALADVNGDTRMDVAVTDPPTNSVRVILQDQIASGRFVPAGTYPAGAGVTNLEIAEVDLDGAPDMITSIGRGLLALRQDGAAPGSFPAALHVIIEDTLNPDNVLPAGHDGLAVGDLNDDGLLDVAEVRWGYDGARIYYHDQAVPGTFGPAQALKLGLDAPGALAVGDLDQDGFADVVAAGEVGLVFPEAALHLRLQSAAAPGTFLATRKLDLSNKGSPLVVVLADVTDDAKPDVLIAKLFVVDHGLIEVLEQTGPPFGLRRVGVFPSLTLPGVDPYLRGFAVADLNDDGLPDMAVTDGELAALFNDPAAPGHFLPARGVLD